MVIYGKSDNLKYHTMLGDVFPTLHGCHISLTWMLTDLECNSIPESIQADELIIISGEGLDALILNEPDLQTIWGVLPGLCIPSEDIDRSKLPEAEDRHVWGPSYQIQHPQAESEFVAWDSTATFFRSKNPKAMDVFRRKFPAAQTLESFNQNKISDAPTNDGECLSLNSVVHPSRG